MHLQVASAFGRDKQQQKQEKDGSVTHGVAMVSATT
jgi:hypothetical protein